jgi:hypothetical protein
MSLLPDEIAGKTFERRRRSYDTAQVDIEHATAALRYRAGAPDQVDQLEELVGMIRAGVGPGWPRPDGLPGTLATDGASVSV